MLVPFFGIASAAVVLHEPVHATDIIGGLLVVGGVLAGALRTGQTGPTAPGVSAELTGRDAPALSVGQTGRRGVADGL
jgi:O-acetylserine/cysteine efflux transporter